MSSQRKLRRGQNIQHQHLSRRSLALVFLLFVSLAMIGWFWDGSEASKVPATNRATTAIHSGSTSRSAIELPSGDRLLKLFDERFPPILDRVVRQSDQEARTVLYQALQTFYLECIDRGYLTTNEPHWINSLNTKWLLSMRPQHYYFLWSEEIPKAFFLGPCVRDEIVRRPWSKTLLIIHHLGKPRYTMSVRGAEFPAGIAIPDTPHVVVQDYLLMRLVGDYFPPVVPELKTLRQKFFQTSRRGNPTEVVGVLKLLCFRRYLTERGLLHAPRHQQEDRLRRDILSMTVEHELTHLRFPHTKTDEVLPSLIEFQVNIPVSLPLFRLSASLAPSSIAADQGYTHAAYLLLRTFVNDPIGKQYVPPELIKTFGRTTFDWQRRVEFDLRLWFAFCHLPEPEIRRLAKITFIRAKRELKH